jgi:hypothetical protein
MLARRVLLDGLEALDAQRAALVLVGAQAIYLHVGEADLAVAPFTTDGDLALDPGALSANPRLEDALRAANFAPDLRQPGIWIGQGNVTIDLLVPEALGGGGRRGARLGVHGNRVARKARGLEAALVDNAPTTITALEEGDPRSYEIAVAGAAALLVAKLHKIAERQDRAGRSEDKDALDVLRLLRGTTTEVLASGLERLAASDLAGEVTREAVRFLEELFGTPDARGAQMAARAATPLEDPTTIAASCAGLAGDLLQALRQRLSG